MDRSGTTLADYLAIAISPALIMALVGSLVFFLLEILYAGRYYSQLQWTLFFFVFGAVLIARISMQAEIAERAPLYGVALGLAVWLALLRYVEFPEDHPGASWAWAINLGLLAFIWWSAHRLTWDCTLIDDEVDASGKGLLQLTGLEKEAAPTSQIAKPLEKAQAAEALPRKTNLPGLAGWWQRYDQYRAEARKKPQAPGTWVIYFSLAALPLFGLGQTQIPAEEGDRRAYVFGLMCIYSGSGLGLLLTTSFLGLRRYLRQRKLRMPLAMTGAWLTGGCLLIALTLFLSSFLPRPEGFNSLLSWAALTDPEELDPNQEAKVGDGSKKKDEQALAHEKKNSKEESDKEKASRQELTSKNPKKSGKTSAGGENSGGKKKRENKSPGKSEPERPEPDPKALPSFLSNPIWRQLATILKWVVLGIVFLLIAFFLLRVFLKFLANFTSWADRLLNFLRNWWHSLAGNWKKTDPAELERRGPEIPRLRPFSFFADPFLTGRAQEMSFLQLVNYSFEALEAWARGNGRGRHPEETPLEFGQRLGVEVPLLQKEVCRLAGYYVALAYAPGVSSPPTQETLRDFWFTLGETAERSTAALSRIQKPA